MTRIDQVEADMSSVAAPDGGDAVESAPRPQSLMLSFFGIHVLGRQVALSSASIIDVLARAGVGEDAVRSTLTRMVRRDLLERHRRGRKMYFGLTPRAVEVLRDGHRRVWQTGAVNRAWDGTWTIVGFSLPDSWRRERHDLRSRLLWGGFGPLQSGMWAAPGRVDIAALVDGLGLEAHLKAFQGAAVEPTDAARLIDAAFDVAGIARRYQAFLARWDRPEPVAETDDLARQLLLHTDWLDLVRRDPHLPAEHLPGDWPAVRAEKVFHSLAHRYEEPARAGAAAILDGIALD
ncbi:PaaX family transcriptional regulator [Actinoallomurus purpureus]|uniref:PaaX family transcriptional regulator n=1 Tax=Actinoallomurus purpureus TaxID=478114 RepID=UPI00209330A8|nr:PaaX family transcriptional regulator C-terminal domain-containing protein [Actinoallomurus purpureus]MCO6003674.1 PaaX family transcriptional regulator [Actinoallomurus purpureus]